MSETALLLTGGLLATDDAKTAHGLVRGPSRFRLLGAVDEAQAGRDAGEVLDGHRRELPCFASLAQALTALGRPDGPDWPAWLVVGVAVRGGKLPAAVRRDLLEGIAQGIGAVNGLHQLLEDDPEIVAAALASGARLHDVRRVKKFSELRFWSGEAL